LQCAAVCCSVLQCVAVCCSVLQCVAVCCSVLQCAAVCCERIFPSINFSSECHGFMQKRPRKYSIPPKLSVANSFNNEGKLDRRLFKI